MSANTRKIKLDISDRIIRSVAYMVLTAFALCCLIPFILLISTSFSTESLIERTGFSLVPQGFTTYAYNLVMRSPDQIIGAYRVTIALTVTGTIVGLFIIAMTGYALQRADFPFRNGISFYIYFTTLFSGGLVPFYLLITKYLNLADSYLAVWFPLLMSPWLIILMKNFIKSIPMEITESGKIDGASDFTIFIRLIFPNLKPALATIGLFLALGYWNEWYNSLLFLSSRVEYKPLQFFLYNIINKAQALQNSMAGANVILEDIPMQTLKMATAVVATGPIVLLYPFVQRYFIAGITVGAVKG